MCMACVDAAAKAMAIGGAGLLIASVWARRAIFCLLAGRKCRCEGCKKARAGRSGRAEK